MKENKIKRFLGHAATRLMIHLLPKNISKREIFAGNQSDLREDRKKTINKLFIGLRSWPTFFLKNTAHLAKRNICMNTFISPPRNHYRARGQR